MNGPSLFAYWTSWTLENSCSYPLRILRSCDSVRLGPVGFFSLTVPVVRKLSTHFIIVFPLGNVWKRENALRLNYRFVDFHKHVVNTRRTTLQCAMVTTKRHSLTDRMSSSLNLPTRIRRWEKPFYFCSFSRGPPCIVTLVIITQNHIHK